MTLSRVIEALLFSVQKPLSIREVATAIRGAEDELSPNEFSRVREAEVAAALEQLKIEYVEQQRAFQLAEKAEGWQLATDTQYAQKSLDAPKFPDARCCMKRHNSFSITLGCATLRNCQTSKNCGNEICRSRAHLWPAAVTPAQRGHPPPLKLRGTSRRGLQRRKVGAIDLNRLPYPCSCLRRPVRVNRPYLFFEGSLATDACRRFLRCS